METLIHLVPKTIAEKLVWERSLNSELQKKLSEALTEKGVLKSEIDEWKFKFTALKVKFETTDYKRDENLRNQYIKVPENITLKNLSGYINNKVMGKYQMGGTNYAPVLNAIYKDFKPSNGFLGLGKQTTMDQPVYVIFITDGENFDHNETEEVIVKMAELGFFIQFLGIGSTGFYFLSKLDNLPGRKLDNANFFKVPNLDRTTDSELYSLLMKEFPSWTTQARTLNLIK